MKTVTVSEIIRTSQFGDTRYVLASEAQERERALQEERDQWKEISRDWRKEAETALIEIAALREQVDELSKVHTGEGTFPCTCTSYPHSHDCGIDARIVALRERQRVLVEFINYLLSDQIYKDLPLEHVHNDDARYNWPHRWDKVLELASAALAAKEG